MDGISYQDILEEPAHKSSEIAGTWALLILTLDVANLQSLMGHTDT